MMSLFRNASLLAVCAALAGGCKSNTTTMTTTDGGTTVDSSTPICPIYDAPAGKGGTIEPCCALQSNASRLDRAQLRLAGLSIGAPAGTLSSTILHRVLQQAFDKELFNWLLELQDAPMSGMGSVTVLTGYGTVDTNNNFAFVHNAAPTATGDAGRWNPVTLQGMMDGEVLTTQPFPGVLTVPVFSLTDPTMVTIELPLYDVQIANATFNTNRSCIGGRSRIDFDPTHGQIAAFLRVADSMQPLSVPDLGINNSNLCATVSGQLTNGAYCTSTPQAMWLVKPNALCDSHGCVANMTGTTTVCDPGTTCNAWQVTAGFAAQGINIDNSALQNDAGTDAN